MNPILLATDFSDYSFEAATYAYHLASRTKADLHLLNVYHVPAPLQVLPVEIMITPEELKADTEKQLGEIISKLTSTVGGNVQCFAHAISGHPVKEIDLKASELNVSLVIIGMHGSGFLREKIMGSTAGNLIEKCSKPVLVVPSGCTFQNLDSSVLAFDGGLIPDGKFPALLSEFGGTFGGKTDVVTIVPPHSIPDKETIISHIDKFLADIPHEYHFPESSSIVNGIEEFITTRKSRLVVLFTRKHSLYRKLFQEPASRKMIFHSPVPILCIPA